MTILVAGGTGRLGMKTREEDFVAQLIVESTHAYLLCFTNGGQLYWRVAAVDKAMNVGDWTQAKRIDIAPANQSA